MLVDETIEASYHSITKARRNMINCLRSGSSTASEIEEETGSDRSYIHDCLKSFRECGLVTVSEGSGKDGADEWEWIGPGLTADLPEVLVEVDF
jgi:predicted transcriptional regulator